jgi:hypothetical protein
MNGTGIFRWPDGRIYEGEFVNDLKQGKGRIMWPDGNKVYDGEWNNDHPHGIGVMIY